MAVVTPSAKSHERVSGRWMNDFEAKSPVDRMIYVVKVAVGSPIPWLMWSYALVAFLSRAGVELAAWLMAILTFIYILADRFGSEREFRFFPIGGDIFLAGFFFAGIVTSIAADSPASAFAALGGIRWVILFYLLVYAWELFPGLNRMMGLLTVGASVACAYGIWQHFTGVDLLSGTALPPGPIASAVVFTPRSFFGSPEIMGTLLAMISPFPFVAYLLADRRDPRWQRYCALALGLAFCLLVFWSYRLGIWIAAFGGVLVAMLMQPRHVFGLLVALGVLFGAMTYVSYGSPGKLLDSISSSEEARATRQRAQINTQVTLWQGSPWTGAGQKALDAANYDPGTGNVYFQILAQSGVLGAGFYLLFILGYMLSTYRSFSEIPESHYWHRVLIAGSLASQIAFHLAGLYWCTMNEAFAFDLFVLILSATSYVNEHYGRGLVTDDYSL